MFLQPNAPKSIKKEQISSDCTYLSAVKEKYDISDKLLIELLDNYFSADEIREIDKFVSDELDMNQDYEVESKSCSECDTLTTKPEDSEEVLVEESEVSTDELLDKVSDNDIKKLVQDNGVKLDGSESSEELKGMAKALAATNESISKQVDALLIETTKLKRRKIRKKAEEARKSKFIK